MFITKEEFTTHIYLEVLDAISDSDDSKITSALNTATRQAAGYLERFDTVAIFATEGEEKEKYADLATYIKDIAKWHFIAIANASVDLELAESRYKMAIAELGKIQSGKITPKDWPLVTEPAGIGGAFYIQSNPKRGNYY